MKKCQAFLWAFIKIALLVICVIMLVCSSYRLYNYNRERAESKRIAENVVSDNPTKHAVPISVDFEKIKQENNDIIAWLYCDGTPINYPVVQAQDNSYYLRRGIDGEYSLLGTLFVDYLNKEDFSDNNTIIYGHNMKNDTMFGVLTKYASQEYYDEHPKMYLLTPEKEYKVKLIAGITVNSTASIYRLPLEDKQKEAFISELRDESTFETEYAFAPDDKYVMLSTCSYAYDDARYVLVGLLEEI